MNEKDPALKFISVLGYDRSGTTFLGAYIDMLDKRIFFTGEIDKGIDLFLKGRKGICSCGKSYTKCPVWGQILPALEPGNPDFDFVFKKIKEITGAATIVDSSKNPAYIKSFKKIFGQNYSTIHLKRNPKGMVLSRLKGRKRRLSTGSHPRPFLAKRFDLMMIYDSLDWNVKNLWMEKFKQKESNLDLTYDSLDRELPSKLFSFLKERINFSGEEGFSGHSLAGNRGRFSFTKTIEISRTWSSKLKTYQKVIVDLLTLPVRVLFDYKFR